MSILARKLIRDLLLIRGRVLALLLIIGAGCGIFFGIQLALSNLLTTQQQMLKDMHFADVEVQLLPEDRDNLPNLTALPMIESVESRLVFPGFIQLADGRPLTTLMIFQDTPQTTLNQLRILQGDMPLAGQNEVLIDRALAEFHGYKVGDRIAVNVGRKLFERRVAGIVMSPEFLVTSSNPDYVVAEPGSVGVVWAELGDLRKSLGFSMVNSLLLRLRADADPNQALAEIARAVRSLNVERLIPQAENYSTKQLRMEINAFGTYSPAIIVTLILLALAMGVITFRRFAVEKQREFAVLLSLGIPRRRILVTLLILGAVLGVLGGGLGWLIGWFTGGAIGSAYAQAMKLPEVIRTFEPWLAIQTLGLGICCGVMAVLVSCWPMLWRLPRELLTEQSRGHQWMPLELARWPLLLRFIVRDLWRQRELSLAAILAMGGSVGVAISYGLAMTSNFDTVGESFKRDSWNYTIDFRYPVYQDEAEELLRRVVVAQGQPYFRSNTEVRLGSHYAIGALSGQVTGALHSQAPGLGRVVSRDGEAVISQDLLRELNGHLGDELELQKGNQQLTVRVVGVTDDIFLQTVTLTMADAQKLAQMEDKVSGYYLQSEPQARQRLIAEGDLVARVTDRQQLYESLMRQMGDKMGMVNVTIVFAIMVSLLIVTTLVHLSIAERRGEYSTLRALGFSRSKLRRFIFLGVAVQLALALLLSPIIGVLLVHLLNARMGEVWYAVEAHYSLRDFLLPMFASVVVAPFVGWLGINAVMKLNVPAYLRGRTI
ncbi:ABC transporter permease [Pseudomonas sp. Irchel s3a18]|uniref:ABC transporter permease n=1 Tax=Pseudomonas sp. Irchel s3a18 TaxID=2009053 RepID=UPI000BA43BC0|nr:ABC transporter permease [Pseudomonas sp. Irchel s3a18]